VRTSQGVDGQPDLDHLLLGTVEDLGGQLLSFFDDLLDGHRPDDRAQVTGENSACQDRHLVLVGQESLSGADDTLAVVADLEGNDGSNVQGDPLLGDAPFLDLGLTHCQCEEPNLSEERHDESAVSGHHTKWGVACSSAAGDQHRLIRRGHSVAEHGELLRDSWCSGN
jgi:hypothetical protein